MIVRCCHLFDETLEFLFFLFAFFLLLLYPQLGLYFEFYYLFPNFLPYITTVVKLLLKQLDEVASFLYIHFFEGLQQQINKLSDYTTFLLEYSIKMVFFSEKFSDSIQAVIVEVQESYLAADVDGFSVVVERFFFRTRYFLDL